MRLAIVNHHGRAPGGSEVTMLLHAAALPPDIEPYFFFFEDGELVERVRERYANVRVIPMSRAIADSTRSHPRLRGILTTPPLILKLAFALRASRIDVVLTNSMKAHVIGSLAAKTAAIPCVNKIGDIPVGFARVLVREISRFCAVDRVTCSQAAADSLGLKNASVVYPPLDLSKYESLPSRAEARARLGLPDDGLPIVSIVGRIARWKGQDRFLRIGARVRSQMDAHFVIVGSPIFGCDDRYVPELRALVAERGMESRVHFISWRDDLRDVYAASDICCNCSDAEPFGRTTIEAMACGVPVMCFADAGACESFADGVSGAHVPVGDEDAYAASIVEFLGDADRLARARITAIRDASAFDMASSAAAFRKVFYAAMPAAHGAVVERTVPIAQVRQS